MAYNWAQLAFVEKWRLHGVRGQIIGMHRPADRTLFDLRLRPSEGLYSSSAATQDIRLLDAGDIIREKRIALLDKALVVIRAVGTASENADTPEIATRPRHLLESGSTVSGALLATEEDILLLDVGFPIVVQLQEQISNTEPGRRIRVSLAEVPKGFLVV